MKFLIWAYPFNNRSGGIIALHLLCQRLVDAGEVAMLWPRDRPPFRLWQSPRKFARWVRYHLMRPQEAFDHGPFDTKLARSCDLRDAIVVYPEVVTGNPLGARHVVRWLLHRPGFHTGQVEFGSNDLLFFYQDAFHDPSLGDYADSLLTLTWWNSEYFDRGGGNRSGSAYLIRKGAGRTLVHDQSESIKIDDLTHAEKAEVFNRTKYFYTYDPYTLYSRYAAICGCIPIIIPPPGLSKEDWAPREEDRYGLAYGVEDVPWAIATRECLMRRIISEQAEEQRMLRDFIAKCRDRFGGRC